jgi:hypothetical protein
MHNVFIRIDILIVNLNSPYISPNDGFKLQLALFEVYCLGKSSVARCVDKEWRFYEWNRYALPLLAFI